MENKNKVIFIMGATATGKSQLAINIASQIPAQIINSDKIQVYNGLDIVTNKISEWEMNSIPHHLIGVVDDPNFDFTATHFRCEAMSAIHKIVNGSGQIPIIVGGSNSFIEALVEDPNLKFKSEFDCCFIWLDASFPVLFARIAKRVDQMVEAGLVEEVRGIFSPDADYDRGIRRAIGVPELDRYFRAEKLPLDKMERENLLESAIHDTKENTCKLACRQIGKIRRLREERGWKIHRIDATAAFEGPSVEETEIAWKGRVLRPCMEIVKDFLYN